MNSQTSTQELNRITVMPAASLNGVIESSSAVSLPGDKSLSHRAALFAAMADGDSFVEHFLVSGVTRAMLDALTAIGVKWDLQTETLTVHGIGLKPPLPLEPIYIHCGNSATTMRLLAGALAAWNLPAVLDGSEGLRRRPMGRIVQPLRLMGVNIEATDGCAPLTLLPVALPLQALEYELPVASAQVKSCLLLAGLSAGGETILREPGPSRDHTERMLNSMGVNVHRELLTGSHPYVTRQTPLERKQLSALRMRLPADISSASFLIVAALITPGSKIIIRGVGLNPTRTGLLDALDSMGAEIQISNRSEQAGEPVGDLTVCYSQLRGTHVNGELVVRMIDEFPAFAVAAAFAHGESVVTEAIELRHKESDRIHVLCSQLARLGAEVTETEDGFRINGQGFLNGGEIDPHGDHRLAMSLAVAGMAAREPVIIQHAQIISESFPAFTDVFNSLGADIRYGQHDSA